MLLINNISLAPRADAAFHEARRAFKPEKGEVFALVWVSSHVEADGATVPGFEAGYMCGPLYLAGLASPWIEAQLSDGSGFYFMPRWTWRPHDQYVIDKQGPLFSIKPA
jgi:hypothetical protein